MLSRIAKSIVPRYPVAPSSIFTRTMASVAQQQPHANGSAEKKAAAPAPSVTPEQIAIVKATAPVLKEHGVTITSLFYKNMLDAHPELRNIFSMSSQATGRQPRALAASVLAYATYIDDLPKLQHAVERIAHKHVSLTVQPEHYPIVGKYLMEAIGAVLGDAATPEIVDAWTNAYGVLANVFIGLEGSMYKAHEKWTGWRKFKIAKRVKEADNIESFYLAPVDGVPLPTYLPGQYISLQVKVPELGHFQSRQYSLSQAPRKEGDYYRISVKREEGATASDVPGLISNMLHRDLKEGDVVELTHPQGEFFVDPADAAKAGAPLVLISGGVGATPIMSILDTMTQPGVASQRPISWLHASRSKQLQPFAAAVRSIRDANSSRVSSRVFLNSVAEGDVAGTDYDFGGLGMDLSKVDKAKDLFVDNTKAEYYLCGPEQFMIDIRQELENMGVEKERTHLELFATGDIQ
ncbi:uncharacterized protein E0L32_006109 [Thyridium curvatum]|uniref:nitric oxide dioxygenase n=1 Tax=Thyridium curvatum TaxID=1093900 RepID=A0A507B7J4_9PEZI|nr:uncharacterized protein E0L32_006109 [Thyridium curvatum]TPX13379.1 hypothetical protein E0L32_006109 [Thyridium curvatum]